MNDVHGQLHLVNALGMRVSVDFAGDAFGLMRSLGRAGWGPLEVPAGGFRLPLALHDKFDWSLIGAYPLTIDGESGVMFQGQFYKQRSYEEQVKGKKLPAAIKYSRGAKKTDPPHIVEEGSGDSAYVTLISFRGNGKSIPQFEIPAQAQPAAQQRREAESAPPLRGEALADAQATGQVPVSTATLEQRIAAIRALVAQKGFAGADIARVVRDATAGKTTDFTKIKSPSEAAAVFERLAKAPARKAS